MRQIARGEAAALPTRYQLVRVAHAWQTTVDDVRDWPADDVMDEVNLLPILGVGVRRGK